MQIGVLRLKVRGLGFLLFQLPMVPGTPNLAPCSSRRVTKVSGGLLPPSSVSPGCSVFLRADRYLFVYHQEGAPKVYDVPMAHQNGHAKSGLVTRAANGKGLSSCDSLYPAGQIYHPLWLYLCSVSWYPTPFLGLGRGADS